MKKRDHTGAAVVLQKLMEEDPTSPRWPHKLGEVRARQGLNRDAVMAYKRAAQIYRRTGHEPKAEALNTIIQTLTPVPVRPRRQALDNIQHHCEPPAEQIVDDMAELALDPPHEAWDPMELSPLVTEPNPRFQARPGARRPESRGRPRRPRPEVQLELMDEQDSRPLSWDTLDQIRDAFPPPSPARRRQRNTLDEIHEAWQVFNPNAHTDPLKDIPEALPMPRIPGR